MSLVRSVNRIVMYSGKHLLKKFQTQTCIYLSGCPLTCVSCPLTSQLCRFTTPVPHLAVYSGMTDPPSANASPSLPFLAHTPACPSPISVALDSTSASERRAEASEGESEGNPEARASAGGNVSKSRMALSLRRLLKRGCTPSSMFASLSPKCNPAAGTSSRIQPISPDEPSQAPPRRIGKYVTVMQDFYFESHMFSIIFASIQESYFTLNLGGSAETRSETVVEQA